MRRTSARFFARASGPVSYTHLLVVPVHLPQRAALGGGRALLNVVFLRQVQPLHLVAQKRLNAARQRLVLGVNGLDVYKRQALPSSFV